tara:strand:+ start:21924 stop:25925 length:4002 start_codon:yes stop_codon:yes gene_type:complete
MRSGLITEATVVGGSLFVVGAALMQFRQEGITDKKYWPYLGVFITGFSAHLIFEAFGLNKKYCETAFQSEVKEGWGEEVEWDEDAEDEGKPDWRQDVEWDAESKDEARMKKYEKTYGKEGAKVRNRIFKRILAKAQDGTKAGQWSARKAQSLTEDYEKAMKGKGKKAYKGGKKTKSQKSLKRWGDQKWTTKSGKKSSKTGERYLPEKAIKALSDKQYKETSDKKRKDTKKGKQFSKQPKKIADKVKKYRADDSWGRPMGSYYYEEGQLKRPSKSRRVKMGWTKDDDELFEKIRKSKQQEPKEITEFEKEMIWVENMFNQNRYYCKRYEDVPYLQRKTFSGKNLRRGNRCYNCRSKDCPSDLLSWKQAHRLADEADDRRAKTYGVRDELIESGEYPQYLRRDRDSIMKDLFGAEGSKRRSESFEGEKYEEEIKKLNYIISNNRYFCKKYDDVPLLKKKSFSIKTLRRGNRCYNCRSKDCPTELLKRIERKKQEELERIAKEQKQKRERNWMENVVKPRREEVKRKAKKSKEMKLGFYDDDEDYTWDKFFWDAEGDIPYGVHVESHKTTSTVFYKRKPFRKFRGNRHREQAQSYASFMESKLKRNPRYFNYYAESFEAEDETQAYLMCDWNKKVPYEIHNAGCKHRNFYEKRWESDIDLWNPTSLEGVCRDYIQVWEENIGGTDEVDGEDLDAIAKMTFSQFMRSNYTKTTTPIKLSPCHKQNPKIKEFMDNILVGDISPLKYLDPRKRAESFEAEGKPTSVEVKRSTNDEKKLMAVFTYPDERTKTTHFGQRGASDYTKHGEKERMERYLERHGGGTTTSTKEDWKDPTTAGALSRWILWNKPSLSASFNDFKKRFNLKGELKVSKSAESFESEDNTFNWGDSELKKHFGFVYFTPKRVRQMPTHIIYKANPTEIAKKTMCGIYLKGKNADFNVSWPNHLPLRPEHKAGGCKKCYEIMNDMLNKKSAETFQAPYTPSQELSDYTPEEIVESSAIDGFQPSKFSVMGNRAESFEADSCRECGRKEGPYSDTVLIACRGCPELSCQHCLDEENNGCAFCIKKRAESTTKGLNLVMMGVPGSGKGTQSKLITKEYGWPQIGMGDLIRDNMRRKTPLGVKCEPYMAKGSLVPDEIMIELVSQRLKEDDCKNGFILDGFPRTVPQGKALEKITNIDAVFFLDTEKQVVIERLGGRRTCSDCGEIYHQLFQPPQQEGTCDLCKGELFIRPDDNPKTISNRLSVFKTKTQPLIDFYEQRNLLRPIQSNSTPQDVFESIDSDIQSMLISGDTTALEAQDTPYCDYHSQLVLGAENGLIMGAEHYTGSRPMTCPICINTLSEY